jgi:aminopeptidase
MDPRYRQFAQVLTSYSVNIQPGEHVLLQTDVSVDDDMNQAVTDAVRDRGGVLLKPEMLNPRLQAMCLPGCTEASLGVDATSYLNTIKGAHARIILRGYENPFELSSVPKEDGQRYAKYYGEKVIGPATNLKWILTGWPTKGFAQLAGLSTNQAKDLFFRAVLADYSAMEKAVEPLKALMERTKYVGIYGPGDTKLIFSIDGIGAIPCVGHRNIPDGECYTAPVRNSVEGVMHYNTPTITKSGDRFSNVRFLFEEGRIVKASCGQGNQAKLDSILDTDDGARHIGEFSLGFNWGIDKIIGDTLFDEKVGGTLHFTPGKAYENAADNGNRSGVHWDIVADQRQLAGGGEIFFDDVLVRKNGIFVLPELAGLNPIPNRGVTQDLLSSAFDSTTGPVRPDEINQEAVRAVLKETAQKP